MKNFNQLRIFLFQKFDELQAARLREKQVKDPGAQLTPEDLAQLGEELKLLLRKEIFQAQPAPKPGAIAAYYHRAIPSVRTTTQEEERKRGLTWLSAAEAYAKGLYALFSLSDAAALPVASLEELLALGFFTDEEHQEYFDLLPRAQGENPSEEDLQKRNLLLFRTLRRVVEENEALFSRDWTDDALIEKYPKLSSALALLTRGYLLLRQVREHPPASLPPEELSALERQLFALAGPASLLERRMALLSDPNYPYIRLEGLMDASPHWLNTLYNYADNSADGPRRFGLKVIPPKDQDESADEDEIEDEDEDEDDKERDSQLPTISQDENVLDLTAEFRRSEYLLLARRIAAAMNLSYEELHETGYILDENGNHLGSLSLRVLCYYLSPEKSGQLYVCSGREDGRPLPVFIDQYRHPFTAYVGAEEVTRASLPEPAPPELSWMSQFSNWLSRRRNGPETETVRQYKRDKVLYEHAGKQREAQAELREGRLPRKVLEADRENTLVAQAARRRQERDSCLQAIRYIPPEPEVPFDTVLARLLVNQAFLLTRETPLRNSMEKLLGVYDSNYREQTALAELRRSDAFRDFSLQLRGKHGDVLLNLQSSNPSDAELALTELSRLFANHFKDGQRPPLSPEYIQRREVVQGSAQKAARKETNEERFLPVKGEARKQILRGVDNAPYWRSILSFYGPRRELRPDWLKLSSNKAVYTWEDWKLMQKLEVKEPLSPEGIPLDEKSFASLCMVLSLRRADFFTPEKLGTRTDAPHTMPFEDVVAQENSPRDGVGAILAPLTEPTRGALLRCLRGMNAPQAQPFSLTGKEVLAGDLARALHLYACRVSRFSWRDRSHSALAEVGTRVLAFAEQHNMLDLLQQQGLTEEDLESIRLASRLGELSNRAFNAETALLRDCDGSHALTAEERREYLDRIMLLKAVQAEVGCAPRPEEPSPARELERQKEERSKLAQLRDEVDITPQEYRRREQQLTARAVLESRKQLDDYRLPPTPVLRSLLTDGAALKELSHRLMPADQREPLMRRDGSAALSTIRCAGNHPITEAWTQRLREEREEREKLAALETHLAELAQVPENRETVEATRGLLPGLPRDARLTLAGLEGAKLLEWLKSLKLHLEQEQLRKAQEQRRQAQQQQQPQPNAPGT